jgi:hypothetical protein
MANILFPVFVICPRDSMHLWNTLDGELEGNLYAYTKGYWNNILLFDAAGNKWKVTRVTPNRKIYPIEKIMASICWNPKIKVRLEFDKPKPYPLEALKKEISALVDFDDDILTQFIEANDLKEVIKTADNFEGLVDILKRYNVIV